MNTTFWKIRDKQTNLFYGPSRMVKIIRQDELGNDHELYVKTNLSKDGKIYNKKPSLKYFNAGINDHTMIPRKLYRNEICPSSLSMMSMRKKKHYLDFEIVEYRVIEVRTYNE